MKKKQIKLLKKRNERQSQLIQTLTATNNMQGNKINCLSAQLAALEKVNDITEQAIISCENANDMLHDKLECYREVIKDIN